MKKMSKTNTTMIHMTAQKDTIKVPTIAFREKRKKRKSELIKWVDLLELLLIFVL
jgi:hypothetical protein